MPHGVKLPYRSSACARYEGRVVLGRGVFTTAAVTTAEVFFVYVMVLFENIFPCLHLVPLHVGMVSYNLCLNKLLVPWSLAKSKINMIGFKFNAAFKNHHSGRCLDLSILKINKKYSRKFLGCLVTFAYKR